MVAGHGESICPPGSRYALKVDVGHIVEKGTTQRISAAEGHSQHMGIQGQGETVVIVERFAKDSQQLLGVSIGIRSASTRPAMANANCF